MKTMKSRGALIGLFVLLVTLVFLAATALPTMAGDSMPTGPEWNQWRVPTYRGDMGPFYIPAIPLPESGVYFDFLNTPDRAMLTVDSPLYKGLLLGDLTGKTLKARVEIEATSGATFNFYNTGGTHPASVRLYFRKANAKDCPTGWAPDRPECEAQYWWSNPVHFDLADLAAQGSTGLEFAVPLDPGAWSDRDGHINTATSPVDHPVAFAEAVANVDEIGLSFGGGNNFAFGCGVDEGYTARFKLHSFVAE
jgi:hypothetical protein